MSATTNFSNPEGVTSNIWKHSLIQLERRAEGLNPTKKIQLSLTLNLLEAIVSLNCSELGFSGHRPVRVPQLQSGQGAPQTKHQNKKLSIKAAVIDGGIVSLDGNRLATQAID